MAKQPNQNNSVWKRDPTLLERAIDLRVNYGMSWEAIRKVLDLDSADQVRIKVNRTLRRIDEGRETPDLIPSEGSYEYDFSMLTADELPYDYLTPEEEDEEEEEAEEEELEYEIHSRIVRYDYHVSGDDILFTVNNQIVAIPLDVWERIVADYSAQGGNLTQYEIAKKYGINKKVLEACLRSYGHYKARPPVTREKIKEAAQEGDFDPLVKNAIEVQEARFSAKLERERWRRLEEENRRLREESQDREQLMESVRRLVEEMAKDFPRAREVEKVIEPGRKIFDCHAPIFDTHIGLQTLSERGWTTDYSTDIAVRMIEQHGVETVREIRERGQCGTLYLSLGGDILHSIMGKTVSGRHVGADLPDRWLVRAAVGAFRTWIETARPYARKIVVKGVAGNHDGVLGELILDFLALAFEGASDVEVDTRPSKQAYFIVGDTLHIIDHGESFTNVTGDKSLAMAERIARRVAGADYYRVRRIIFYVGHMHHREGARTPSLDGFDKSQGHLEILRVPTFCSASNYEELLAFWNEQMSDLFFLDKNGRIKGIERLYAENLDTHQDFSEQERISQAA